MLRRIFAALLAALWLGAAAAADTPKTAQEKPELDPKVVQGIFNCLQPGLAKDWKRAWVVVTELRYVHGTRQFEAAFFYSTTGDDLVGRPLQPACDKVEVAKDVYSFNKALPGYEQRQWKQATLTFKNDGTYELKYDYDK